MFKTQQGHGTRTPPSRKPRSALLARCPSCSPYNLPQCTGGPCTSQPDSCTPAECLQCAPRAFLCDPLLQLCYVPGCLVPTTGYGCWAPDLFVVLLVPFGWQEEGQVSSPPQNTIHGCAGSLFSAGRQHALCLKMAVGPRRPGAPGGAALVPGSREGPGSRARSCRTF